MMLTKQEKLQLKELLYRFEDEFCRQSNNKKCTKECPCHLYNEQGGFACVLDVIEMAVKENVTEDLKDKAIKIVYLCDHRACKECGSGLYCNHTHKIEHAKNFIKIGDTYFEDE